MVWDIGRGGLLSFCELELNTNNGAAAFLATVPERALLSGATIRRLSYYSNVTFYTEVYACHSQGYHQERV
jgi:hypothetical protein